MASFARQPFASTHPAIDALFQREFAQNQEATKEDLTRRQIDASSDLARAQLQHAYQVQDYANLFRERDFQARQDAEKVRQTQADRYLKLYEGQVPNAETERIRQINAAAKAAAARFQAAYDAEVTPKLTAGKDAEIKALWFNGMWPGSEKAVNDKWDDPNYEPRKKVESDAFKRVMDKMAKDPEVRIVIPDPDRRIFMPIQLDEKGNIIPFPAGTNAPPVNPGATNNPAALGPTTGTTTATPGAGNIVFRQMLAGALPSVFVATPTAEAPPPITTPQDGALGTPPTPGVPSVRHAFGANNDVLLMPEDSAIIVKELPHVPETNRPTAYAVMIDQFLKAGRARIVPRAGAASTPLVPATELPNRPPF